MEILVERVNVGQTQGGKAKTGLYANGKWHNIFDAHPEYMGKKLKLKPAKYQGWYEVEFVIDQEPAKDGNGLDPDPKLIVNWAVYETYVKQAHKIAMELEPDGYGPQMTTADDSPYITIVDRSRARAALVNTAMIAVFGKDSKILIEDLKVPF